MLNFKRGFDWVRGFEGGYRLPERKTRGSAGYDFYANERIVVPAHGEAKVKTGVKAYMQEYEVLQLFIRSSYGVKHGLMLANNVGVIDSDYCGNPDNDGEIQAVLLNRGDEDFVIERGQSFMQGIFMEYKTLGDMPREDRTGGVGSTGR